MMRPTNGRRGGAGGFSLVELLIALAIMAMLGLAMALSVQAGFMAYANTAESASTQVATRLTMRRVLKMIRSSELHDAYDPNNPALTMLAPGQSGYPLQTVGLQMRLPNGRDVRLWWAVNTDYSDADQGDLWYEDTTAAPGNPQILLTPVACQRTTNGDPYLFTLASRMSEQGLLLDRATVDLTVYPDPKQAMSIESAKAATVPVRMVGSAMPRRTLDAQ